MSPEQLFTYRLENPLFIGRGKLCWDFAGTIRDIQEGKKNLLRVWQINGFGTGKTWLLNELQRMCFQGNISYERLDLRTARSADFDFSRKKVFLSISQREPFVCLIDNADDSPTNTCPKAEEKMWDYLKYIIEDPRTMIVLARPNEHLLSEHFTLRRRQKQITLPPFTLSETIAQVNDKNLGERIHHFTGGHPALNVVLENKIRNSQLTDYELAILATNRFLELVAEESRDVSQEDFAQLLTLAQLPRFNWEQFEDPTDFQYFRDRVPGLIEWVESSKGNGYTVCEPLKTILISFAKTAKESGLDNKRTVELPNHPIKHS